MQKKVIVMPNKKLFSKIYDAIARQRSPIEINAKKRSDKPNISQLLNLPVYNVYQIQFVRSGGAVLFVRFSKINNVATFGFA